MAANAAGLEHNVLGGELAHAALTVSRAPAVRRANDPPDGSEPGDRAASHRPDERDRGLSAGVADFPLSEEVAG